MAISDIHSATSILRLAMKSNPETCKGMDELDLQAIAEIENVRNKLRFYAETLRNNYDILMAERAPIRERYFNFTSDGDCVEVPPEEYAGTLGSDVPPLEYSETPNDNEPPLY